MDSGAMHGGMRRSGHTTTSTTGVAGQTVSWRALASLQPSRVHAADQHDHRNGPRGSDNIFTHITPDNNRGVLRPLAPHHARSFPAFGDPTVYKHLFPSPSPRLDMGFEKSRLQPMIVITVTDDRSHSPKPP
uniref:Uncharacterized protein n=1 Tax=Eutreptiella gymnastica TaxID=73025 RepID=A0A7S4CRV7_9EUGL